MLLLRKWLSQDYVRNLHMLVFRICALRLDLLHTADTQFSRLYVTTYYIALHISNKIKIHFPHGKTRYYLIAYVNVRQWRATRFTYSDLLKMWNLIALCDARARITANRDLRINYYGFCRGAPISSNSIPQLVLTWIVRPYTYLCITLKNMQTSTSKVNHTDPLCKFTTFNFVTFWLNQTVSNSRSVRFSYAQICNKKKAFCWIDLKVID